MTPYDKDKLYHEYERTWDGSHWSDEKRFLRTTTLATVLSEVMTSYRPWDDTMREWVAVEDPPIEPK